MMLCFYMTSAGIALYICGGAATFIPNSSFLIPHFSRGITPNGLTLNPIFPQSPI